MSPFPIMRVDRNRRESLELLGSKPKFWFRDGQRRLLFKADDRGTGEDWAEVVACALCELLGLPHVHYDLATGIDGDTEWLPGVVCENMAPPPTSLVLGNELLLAIDPTYPREQRFKVRQHSVEAIVGGLGMIHAPDLEAWPSAARKQLWPLDYFVGYVMLDAWIANQDRHHENWAAIWTGQSMRLAPTFDHGAALARNITDEERQERLSTKDQGRSVAAFVQRARSAFYAHDADTRPLSTLDAFLAFGERAPAAKAIWLDRLSAVGPDEIRGILQRIPDARISDVGREFTLALLLENQRRLMDTMTV